MQKQSTKFRIGPLDPSNYASASMFGLENGTFQSNFFKLFGAFWWTAGIFAAGAVTAGALLRPGPLRPAGTPAPAHAEVTTAQAKAGPALPG